MIITRTPYRVSLAGGGTDRKQFYRKEPGQVLSATIDKYLYVVVRRQLGIVEHKIRLNYSHVEFRDNIDNIEHPLIREALRLYCIDEPLEITTFADIPAYTGLGSSSAFAVGLVHAMEIFLGRVPDKEIVAADAAWLETDHLGRGVGKQDHYASAYGGLNRFKFLPDESVKVYKVCNRETQEALQDRLMLFYTGIKRDASEALKTQGGFQTLKRMKTQVGRLASSLADGNVDDVGKVLHVGWEWKKELSPTVSTPQIDDWYDTALRAGASGGKLLGAGGGGFLLFYVRPQHQQAVQESLPLFRVPFRFEHKGSTVIYSELKGAGRSVE